MKIDASRKVIFTALLIVLLSSIFGLIGNVLAGDENLGKWLKDHSISTRELIIAVILSVTGLIFVTYLQLRYSQQTEQISEKKNSPEDIESDVKGYFDSLKERYLKRYESKLDGRFEITLEVSENWDSDTKEFKGEYEGEGQISEAFEYINSAFEKHGRLLIVGNPGVGKTVLLLKLALELLEKADIEKKEAFPVIFNFASWSNEYKNFDDWLISVLNSGEGLSKEFAGKLLQEERIIFLLDGLDELARNEDKEIAAKRRAECLQSLNEYLDRGKKTVICCRIIEFELMQMITGKDAPVSAKVRINDLSENDVSSSLMKAQKNECDRIAANNLLETLNKDKQSELLTVLRTPFYFITALEVFDKQNFDKTNLPKTASDLKNFLTRSFIQKKLESASNPNHFGKNKTEKWLTFLSDLIDKQNLTTFELADLQPFNLTDNRKLDLFSGLFGVLFGVLFGALFGGLFVSLFVYLVGNPFGEVFLYKIFYGKLVGLNVIWVGVLLIGSFVGLFVGLFIGLFVGSEKIQTEDIINLDFSKALNWKLWLKILFVWVGGLVVGSLGSFSVDTTKDLSIRLSIYLYIGMSTGLLVSFIVGLFLGFEEIKNIYGFSKLENPYQRIKGGFLVNLCFSLLLILLSIVGILILGFSFQTIDQKEVYENLYGILVVLIGGLLSLGSITLLSTPFFKHSILRFCLYLEDRMPLKYATFLDYAAEARILEKDGGHWRFRHQNLQDYFAGLDEQAKSPMGN